jgi:hypothetical protein
MNCKRELSLKGKDFDYFFKGIWRFIEIRDLELIKGTKERIDQLFAVFE